MPERPRGEKRPVDVIDNAVMVTCFANSEIQEKPDRVRSEEAGAEARLERLTSQERCDIARKAAIARWQ
ncbi:RNA-binding protein [Roseibium sp. MB-4]